MTYPANRMADHHERISEYTVASGTSLHDGIADVRFYGVIHHDRLIEVSADLPVMRSPRNPEPFKAIPLAHFSWEPMITHFPDVEWAVREEEDVEPFLY